MSWRAVTAFISMPTARAWVHLLDGGIADNLAMRGIINMGMVLSGDIEDLGNVSTSAVSAALW
jgi:hypothetical protein